VKTAILITAGALAFAGTAVVSTQVGPLAPEASTVTVVASAGPACGDFPEITDTGACFAAGVLAFVFWPNIQGAVQWCKWRDANPGEWSRLKTYASTGTTPTQIVTWMGGAMRNALEAYFAAGAPPFTIKPNPAPNACTGKVLAPPTVTGVTPGQTDVTVTVTSP
jgi:hypothetical protein